MGHYLADLIMACWLANLSSLILELASSLAVASRFFGCLLSPLVVVQLKYQDYRSRPLLLIMRVRRCSLLAWVNAIFSEGYYAEVMVSTSLSHDCICSHFYSKPLAWSWLQVDMVNRSASIYSRSPFVSPQQLLYYSSCWVKQTGHSKP
jgi:hypothetical protein